MSRPEMLFVSPRFLFPADSGGKIRTTEILKGLKGGHFEIVLASPATAWQAGDHRSELEAISDRQIFWKTHPGGIRATLRRLLSAFSTLPIPVATDRSMRARAIIERELARRPGVAVFDFAHAAVLAPANIGVPSILFTHNVEAEIFDRHAATARNRLLRMIWRSQARKMTRFEGLALHRFTRIIAVSQRDKEIFSARYRANAVDVIPTGVNLEYFPPATCARAHRVVFTGSMDWLANQDGIEFFLDEAWPAIATAVPDASMTVVGRTPPAALIEKARAQAPRWKFTGSVPDVRPHVLGADVFVIPLRVGGGTRIKAFEAMAMGVPVVSTSIGVEGLMVEPDIHYLRADSAAELSAAVIRLLKEPQLGTGVAARARAHVQQHFSNSKVARRFEEICLAAMNSGLSMDSGCRRIAGHAEVATSVSRTSS